MKRKRSKVVTSLVLSSVIVSSTFLSGLGVMNVAPIVASAEDTVDFKLIKDIGNISNQGNNLVEGQLSKKGTVKAVINEVQSGGSVIERSIIVGSDTYTTGDDGKFSFNIEQQPANTKIVFKFSDGKTEFTKVATVLDTSAPELDTTPPTIKTVNDVKNSSKVISGTVSEPGTVTATAGSNVLGTATVKESNRNGNGDYDFSLAMKDFQVEGATITIQAKDNAKPTPLESGIVNIKVIGDNSKPSWADENKVPSITDSTTVVEGQIDRVAKVQLFVDDKALNETPVTTEVDGKFKITISKQQAGKTVKVKITDFAGNISEKEIVVTDDTLPSIKKVNPVYDTSEYIEGQVSEASTVSVELPSGEVKEIKPDQLDKDGNFKINIPKLAVDSKVKFTAEDLKGNKSKDPYTITVKEDKVAPKLIDPKKIEINDSGATTVKGQISEPGTVMVQDASGKVIVTKTDTIEDNKFTVNIPKQAPNAKLTFIFEDKKQPKPNQSKSTVTVVDVTQPVIVSVGNLSTSSKLITGVVNEPSVVTATSGGKVIGKVTVTEKNKVKEGKYNFVITMRDFQALNTKVTIQAKDYAKPKGLESDIKTVKAIVDTSAPQLVGDPIITDAQSSLQGQVDKYANVQLFVGKTPLNAKVVKTDNYGKFRVSFKKQSVGTEIRVVTSNPLNSSITSEKIIKVTDATAPLIKKVNPVYDTSSYIEGQISEVATVIITLPSGNTKEKKTDKLGNFKIALPASLTKGAKITVSAIDDNNIPSKRATTVTVKEDKTAPKLIEPKEIVIKDSPATQTISGTINEAGTVDVTVNGESILKDKKKVTIGADGKFTVEVPSKPANTKIVFLFEDLKKNQSKKTVVVKDVTNPVIHSATINKSGSKMVISGTVSEASSITATVNGKSIGRVTAKKVDGSSQYKFEINVSKQYQTKGTVINLVAKDYAKPKALESKIVTVNVD